MQSIHSIRTYEKWNRKSSSDWKRCRNTLKRYKKWFNFNDVTKRKKNYPNCPETPDDPHRILIIVFSGPAKADSLFNHLNQQPDIDKTYLYAKDPYEVKYQFLINKKESTDLKPF